MLVEQVCDVLDSSLGIPVIPVNTVGVMGAGLALAARKKWPWVAGAHFALCEWNAPVRLAIGRVVLLEDPGSGQPVILFPTKRHWKDPSLLSYIEEGAEALAGLPYMESPVLIPRLGCGLGGLAWEDVKPILERKLGHKYQRYILCSP